MLRRQFLKCFQSGAAYLAFANLAPAGQPHFKPRARRVIWLFMQGAPSQYETFDYQPALSAAAEKNAALVPPQFPFAPCGESGLPVSSLFPNIAKAADRICLLNAMQTDSAAHAQATIQMHTGSFRFVRPSMGSWVVYGLGTENRDVPGFLSINPVGPGGAQNYSSGFLPATFHGTPYFPRNGALPDLTNSMIPKTEQRKQIDFIQTLNADYGSRNPNDAAIEGIVESYELAFRMQAAVPGLLSLAGESEATRKMYGLDDAVTRPFATQCLLARRLAEAGVRFIELCHPGWDHHNRLRQRITQTSRETDQPIAALITDLGQRGLLDDTLIVWGGEFGRTPSGQNADGRNHNSRGFTMWLAGGGVKGGFRHGVSDAVSGAAVEGRVHLHDLHATVLHLLGMDHTRLVYRYGGRDFRLTDVHGAVVREIMTA